MCFGYVGNKTGENMTKTMTEKEKKFRKWLRDEQNIDDKVLHVLGTKGLWLSYYKKFNAEMKKKK
mgnify:FL=1